MDDYYRILGIPLTATRDEIKKAHRRLARQFHPDVSNADGTQFRAIEEAYEVLNDPAKREAYDRMHFPIIDTLDTIVRKNRARAAKITSIPFGRQILNRTQSLEGDIASTAVRQDLSAEGFYILLDRFDAFAQDDQGKPSAEDKPNLLHKIGALSPLQTIDDYTRAPLFENLIVAVVEHDAYEPSWLLPRGDLTREYIERFLTIDKEIVQLMQTSFLQDMHAAQGSRQGWAPLQNMHYLSRIMELASADFEATVDFLHTSRGTGDVQYLFVQTHEQDYPFKDIANSFIRERCRQLREEEYDPSNPFHSLSLLQKDMEHMLYWQSISHQEGWRIDLQALDDIIHPLGAIDTYHVASHVPALSKFAHKGSKVRSRSDVWEHLLPAAFDGQAKNRIYHRLLRKADAQETLYILEQMLQLPRIETNPRGILKQYTDIDLSPTVMYERLLPLLVKHRAVQSKQEEILRRYITQTATNASSIDDMHALDMGEKSPYAHLASLTRGKGIHDIDDILRTNKIRLYHSEIIAALEDENPDRALDLVAQLKNVQDPREFVPSVARQFVLQSNYEGLEATLRHATEPAVHEIMHWAVNKAINGNFQDLQFALEHLHMIEDPQYNDIALRLIQEIDTSDTRQIDYAFAQITGPLEEHVDHVFIRELGTMYIQAGRPKNVISQILPALKNTHAPARQQYMMLAELADYHIENASASSRDALKAIPVMQEYAALDDFKKAAALGRRIAQVYSSDWDTVEYDVIPALLDMDHPLGHKTAADLYIQHGETDKVLEVLQSLERMNDALPYKAEVAQNLADFYTSPSG